MYKRKTLNNLSTEKSCEVALKYLIKKLSAKLRYQRIFRITVLSIVLLIFIVRSLLWS